jgi:hypothetical protein
LKTSNLKKLCYCAFVSALFAAPAALASSDIAIAGLFAFLVISSLTYFYRLEKLE